MSGNIILCFKQIHYTFFSLPIVGHLYVAGQSDKMSKSLKNVISVSELLAKYTSNHFRMLCLLNNYKKSKFFAFNQKLKIYQIVHILKFKDVNTFILTQSYFNISKLLLLILLML